MSVEDKILRRIRGKPLGWVFTPSRFLDQGSYGAVVLALKEICDRGRIRRLAADYVAMQEMIFGNAPQFKAILSKLHDLKSQINNLHL